MRKKRTYNDCLRAARPFKGLWEWAVKDHSSYRFAARQKWQRKIAEELGWEIKKPIERTYEDCLESAKRFKSFTEWRVQDKAIYGYAANRQWQRKIAEELGWTIGKRSPKLKKSDIKKRLAKLKKEFQKKQPKPKKKSQKKPKPKKAFVKKGKQTKRDAQLKKRGYKYRVQVWLHPENGDVYDIPIYYIMEPTKTVIEEAIKGYNVVHYEYKIYEL